MGRTASENPDSFCRICKCDFRTKFGNFKKIVYGTSVNLFRPSQRKELLGVVLAELCKNVDLPLTNSDNLSSKVCIPCARKIKNVNQLMCELKSSVNIPHPKFPSKVQPEKRRLLTPERGVSPGNRKSLRVNSPAKELRPSKRKCLFDEETSKKTEQENQEPEKIPDEEADHADVCRYGLVDSDLVFDKLNIDGLNSCEKGRSWMKLKVVLVHPNGNVVVRNPTNEKTVQIIRNIVDGCWTAVANAFFDHPEERLQQELRLALRRKVKREFRDYSKSDSVLKATEPEDLAAFSNKVAVTEAKVCCPFWDASIHGAIGDTKDKNSSINQIALATAVVARTRNPKMSAVAYRISNILIHSGASFQDITRLNNLGVCMSPNSALENQRKMGKHFDAKIIKWKSTIEDNKNCLKLLKEVINRQKQSAEEDSMELENNFDLNEETLKSYKSYHPNVYQKVVQSVEREKIVSEEILQEKIHTLEGEKLPFYK